MEIKKNNNFIILQSKHSIKTLSLFKEKDSTPFHIPTFMGLIGIRPHFLFNVHNTLFNCKKMQNWEPPMYTLPPQHFYFQFFTLNCLLTQRFEASAKLSLSNLSSRIRAIKVAISVCINIGCPYHTSYVRSFPRFCVNTECLVHRTAL